MPGDKGQSSDDDVATADHLYSLGLTDPYLRAQQVHTKFMNGDKNLRLGLSSGDRPHVTCCD